MPRPKKEVQTEPAEQKVTLTQEQFNQLLNRINELENKKEAAPEVAVAAGVPVPQLNSQGGVVGVIERYPIDPNNYKDPTDELYDTPELRRFGLRDNFVIKWSISPTRYQTAMGTWYVEPRFELTLLRKQFDEDNNEVVKIDEKTGRSFNPRIILGRVSFFEDPPADMIEAEQAGVSMNDLDVGEFQNKMRMYRYRFWIAEKLNPRPPKSTTSNKKMEVIGGKIYEIDEYSKPFAA